ncbi:MAG: ribulose-phosphate 3-epimerase [Anaerolineaceae bacterium]
MNRKISVSLVSAPFDHLAQTLRQMELSGADYLHYDIEDGYFVPVMNLGTKMLEQLGAMTSLPLDVHLMMVNPEWIIPDIARTGAVNLSVHYEACAYPRRVLGVIKAHGMRAGLAFNPATPIPDLRFCLPLLDFVTVLTTEPETGDFNILLPVLDKVRQAKGLPELAALEWVVDGGVNQENAHLVWEAGADTIVSGRAAFSGGNYKENVERLRNPR